MQRYDYDDAGNRTRTNGGVLSTIGAGNRLTNDGTYRYEYVPEGNMVRRTTISSGEVMTLWYDQRNRLVTVSLAPSLQFAATKVVNYEYDTFNRRVSRAVTTYTNVDGGEGEPSTVSSTSTEKFIYDDFGGLNAGGDHVVLDVLRDHVTAWESVVAQRNRRAYAAWLATGVRVHHLASTALLDKPAVAPYE